MFGQSFHKKWGAPQSEGAKFLIQATEKLIWEEGRDWDDVKFIAQKIMNDMWMSNSNQKKALTIVRRGWRRHQNMIRAGLDQGAGCSNIRTQDILHEMGSFNDLAGVPSGRMIDIRHKLTALITLELYGGGDKIEGRKALMVRQNLDEFFFHTEPTGDPNAVVHLRSAIINETLAEQLEFLEYARDIGGSGKGIKAEMLKLIEDPDRFDRFNDSDKAAIRQIACGMWLFAKARLERLRDTVGRRGIPYMGPVDAGA
jgi:hypothetical protein